MCAQQGRRKFGPARIGREPVCGRYISRAAALLSLVVITDVTIAQRKLIELNACVFIRIPVRNELLKVPVSSIEFFDVASSMRHMHSIDPVVAPDPVLH